MNTKYLTRVSVESPEIVFVYPAVMRKGDEPTPFVPLGLEPLALEVALRALYIQRVKPAKLPLSLEVLTKSVTKIPIFDVIKFPSDTQTFSMAELLTQCVQRHVWKNPGVARKTFYGSLEWYGYELQAPKEVVPDNEGGEVVYRELSTMTFPYEGTNPLLGTTLVIHDVSQTKKFDMRKTLKYLLKVCEELGNGQST